MSVELVKGMKGEYKLERVEEEHTARFVGSGSLAVLASPVLAILFEKAACCAIEQSLPDGTTSVGSFLEFKHLAPTPLGMDVVASAELVEVDGRFLVFSLLAYDGRELIGSGTHHRVLVNAKKFQDKADMK